MREAPDHKWFEMEDIRRRRLATAVWIPLRRSESTSGYENSSVPGYQNEVVAVGTVAIRLNLRDLGEKLGWQEIGLIHNPGPYAFSDGRYKASDVYLHDEKEEIGVELVLEQHINKHHPRAWHVNQDLVLALGLVREGTKWVRPEEGYVEVIRERYSETGACVAIEIRADFLKDYLAARGLALRVASYHQRVRVTEDVSDIPWAKTGLEVNEQSSRFLARVFEVDVEGGLSGEVAVFKSWRTDVDAGEDVPVFGPEADSNTAWESRSFKREGRKAYRVEGELWREEWIEPAERSERVRGDEPKEPIFFFVDAAGTKQSNADLSDERVGRYLWFRPSVIEALLSYRGSELSWYTKDTGEVSCSPSSGVHFGVNGAGLITVYAYDIARLPLWQMKVWVGHNTTPDGGVSAELLAAQQETNPASTEAPEDQLRDALSALNDAFLRRHNVQLFRSHDERDSILGSIHRFRVTDRKTLYAVAKDIARLTADSIDGSALAKVLAPKSSEKWGSLKHLEKVLANKTGDPDRARKLLTPLFGIYELRLGDAHLPQTDIDAALAMAGVDLKASPYVQAMQLLTNTVEALNRIKMAVESV